jgi:GNAT superfamily N-acetyltransferase
VVALTGHIVIAADVDADWVAERVPAGDLSAPMNPPFLSALEQLTSRRVNGIDAMLLAAALTDPTDRAAATAGLTELTDHDHPRVERARRYRDDVHVYGDEYGGLVLTGRGVAGRLECAVEVSDASRGKGHGRRLARAARALIPPDTHVWAQVTPGNAASLRAFLSADYKPVGSEALLVR